MTIEIRRQGPITARVGDTEIVYVPQFNVRLIERESCEPGQRAA